MLSYFGCDQSQVQRYLTAKSIDEARALADDERCVKIPLQLLILSTGVLVFVFYLFSTPPMLFNRVVRRAGGGRPARRASTRRSQQEFDSGHRGAARGGAARRPRRVSGQRRAGQGHPRRRRRGVVRAATGDAGYSDVNYVFPTFITTQMPIGLVGLMIAAIFAAAMSASGGELNALATATIIDFYRRHFVKQATDSHYVRVSKLATFAWGLFACVRRHVRRESGIADRSGQSLRLGLSTDRCSACSSWRS